MITFFRQIKTSIVIISHAYFLFLFFGSSNHVIDQKYQLNTQKIANLQVGLLWNICGWLDSL